MRLAIVYAIIALIATAANLGAQALSVRVWTGLWHIEISVLVGTAVGLVLKYVLDKIYIFRFKADDALHDLQTFILYTGMGVVTTLVFWGFEFGFYQAFQDKSLRYLGGLIGLVLGYWAKYHLDKRFVFRVAAS
ncbi:MAG: GtrA family protein [Reyranella sp.]|jgi:putative flippase GtrA|nr:GtrA family protein [Reyranella sp.]MBL6651084.1 GtrA family protein [Reyranella sp.]